MTTKPAPSARDAWYFWHYGDHESKRRRCIVVAVDGDLVQVIYGRSEPHPRGEQATARKFFSHGGLTDDARELDLDHDTHFRVDAVKFIRRDMLANRIGRCSLALWADLAPIVETARRRRLGIR